jgi:3-oxoacyl-[acyl-carrier-protein] synthase-3
MKYAKIVGLGKHLPEKVLTNEDLEKMVDTSDEWISTRTGIKQRRIAPRGAGSSALAYPAAKQALKRAGMKASEIDLIIVNTITPDMFFPSTACFVQNQLKARNATSFDLAGACSGFLYGLACAQGMIESGIYKNALVIGAETLSAVTDWQDRSTCVLFGDGAGAAVLTAGDKRSFLSSQMGSDGSCSRMLFLPGGGSRNPASHETVDKKMHYIKMRGNELFRLAVRLMEKSARQAVEKAGLGINDVSILIPHQANIRIIDAVSQRLKIPKEKVFVNIDKYGNMSSASTAVALVEAFEQNRLKADDIVVLDTFGGGLVWGSMVIKWL